MVGFTLYGVSTPDEAVQATSARIDAAADDHAEAIARLPEPMGRFDAYSAAAEKFSKLRERFTRGKLESVYDVRTDESLSLAQLAKRVTKKGGGEVSRQRAHEMYQAGEAIRKGKDQ